MIQPDANLLYAEYAVISAVVLGLIWSRAIATSQDRMQQRGFVYLLFFSVCFCVVDAFWGLVASRTLECGTLVYTAATYGFYLMAAVGAFVWSRYTMYYLGRKYFRSPLIVGVQSVLLLFQIALLVYNLITKNVFYISEAGTYVPQELRPLTFILQFAHYILAAFFAVWLFIIENDAGEKSHLRTVIIFSVVPLATGIGQLIFPDAPYYSIGFMLSCLTIYLFNFAQERAELLAKSRERDALEKTTRQLLALREEFEVVYFVDPQTGEYERHISNDVFESLSVRMQNSNNFFVDVFENIELVVHPDDRASVRRFYSSDNLARQLSQQSSVSVNLRALVGDTYVWYSHRAIKSTDFSGKTSYIIGIMNISEAQRAEIEEARKNAVINSLTGDFLSLIYVDLEIGEQRIFKMNDSIFPFDFEQMKVKDFEENNNAFSDAIVYEKDRAYYKLRTGRERIQRRLANGAIYFVDYRAVIDGRIVYLQNKYASVDGSPNRVIIGITDITDAKKKEMHHREELEHTISMRTDELQEKNRALARMNEEIVELIGDIVESRDENCGDHCRRIKGFTHILAEQVMKDLPEYNLTPEDVDLISSASALHDVGKIAIPDAVLLKPGRLTPEEYEMMKSHCVKGCELLKKAPKDWSREYLQTSLDICRWHHEKWDGKGYPDGLKGDEIPISAQIVSIADCYDALTSTRVYHGAFSYEDTYNMIVNGECGVFSERLLACFTRCRAAFEMHAGDPDNLSDAYSAVSLGKGRLADTRILVVEDDPVSLRLTREILESEGALVTEAPNGETAISMITDSAVQLFDVVLMDLFMDEMDGAETTERIRAAEIPWMADVPIVALSASTEEASVRKCTESGMSAYLTKPLSVAALSRVLMNYLRSQTESLQQKLSSAERKASKDPLTGLKNITAYTDAVEQLTDEIRCGLKPAFAIVECDINNLKYVNDTFGHDIGDIYIRNCSQIICDIFKRSNVYRIGGDEFVVIVNGKDYVQREKLLEEMTAEVSRAEKIIDVQSGRASLSFGYSVYDPASDETVSQVFKRADVSMYVNKRLRRKQKG